MDDHADDHMDVTPSTGGMGVAEGNLRALCEALDGRGLAHSEERDPRGRPTVRLRYDMGWGHDLDLLFWFDADGESAQVGTSPIMYVPGDARERILESLNEANGRYRWLRLLVRDDGDGEAVFAHGDLTIAPGAAGEACMEMLGRALWVLEDANPRLLLAML